MPAKGHLALIVDDDPDMVNLIQKILVNIGMEVLNAAHVNEAKEIVTSKVPSLITLDINLDGESGLEILKVVKQDNKLRNIPVIVFTAMSNPKFEEKAIKMGAYKFLKKPLVAKDLIMAVKQAIKSFSNLVSLEKSFQDSKDKPHAKITFSADLFQINELGYTMISPVKLPADHTIELESELMDKLGANQCVHRITRYLGTREGGFLCELSFVGLDDNTAKKIRQTQRR